jgi:predicted site-specific integrase-resolvase
MNNSNNIKTNRKKNMKINNNKKINNNSIISNLNSKMNNKNKNATKLLKIMNYNKMDLVIIK